MASSFPSIASVERPSKQEAGGGNRPVVGRPKGCEACGPSSASDRVGRVVQAMFLIVEIGTEMTARLSSKGVKGPPCVRGRRSKPGRAISAQPGATSGTGNGASALVGVAWTATGGHVERRWTDKLPTRRR